MNAGQAPVSQSPHRGAEEGEAGMKASDNVKRVERFGEGWWQTNSKNQQKKRGMFDFSSDEGRNRSEEAGPASSRRNDEKQTYRQGNEEERREKRKDDSSDRKENSSAKGQSRNASANASANADSSSDVNILLVHDMLGRRALQTGSLVNGEAHYFPDDLHGKSGPNSRDNTGGKRGFASDEGAQTRQSYREDKDKKFDPNAEQPGSVKGSQATICGTLDACTFCRNQDGPLKTCSGCGAAKYCGRSCQVQHYPLHKIACKGGPSFRDACKNMDEQGFTLEVRLNNLKMVSLSQVPHEKILAFGKTSQVAVLVKIMGPYPIFLTPAVYVQDYAGNKSFVQFYTASSDKYIPPGKREEIPLTECLQPGNFILIKRVLIHDFLDGTVGIRIDYMKEVRFIVMD